MRVRIGKIFRVGIEASPEYKSLTLGSATEGNLQAELGVVNPEEKLDEIINEWIEKIKIDTIFVSELGKNIRGKMTIGIVLSSYGDVLKLGSAVQPTSKGDNLEWLEWLLIRGDDQIIVDYVVDIGQFKKPDPSRTGFALMRKVPSQSWGVPKDFVGFPGNNFVTKVLNGKNFQDALILLIKDELAASLRRIA